MKTYTLEREILLAGLSSDKLIGVDNSTGDILIDSISVQELLNGRHKTLRNRKVLRVIVGTHTCDYIFIVK